MICVAPTLQLKVCPVSDTHTTPAYIFTLNYFHFVTLGSTYQCMCRAYVNAS